MDYVYKPGLVLYLPLHTLEGSSFGSRDAYGHLCTVTGGSRKGKGYDFDGIDDRITAGNAITSYPATLCIWARPDNKTGGDVLFYSPVITMAFYTSNYFLTHSSHIGCSLEYFTDGAWAFIAISARNGEGDADLYVDGIERTIYAGNNYGRGGSTYQIANRNGGNYFDGSIGEIMVYRRALTPQEIQHIYLTTRWRYQ